MEEEEYDKLEGLVSPECIAGLKKNLAGLTQEEKRYLRINPEDIFFSFIPVFRSNEAGQTVTLGDYLSNPQNSISVFLQLLFIGKKSNQINEIFGGINAKLMEDTFWSRSYL